MGCQLLVVGGVQNFCTPPTTSRSPSSASAEIYSVPEDVFRSRTDGPMSPRSAPSSSLRGGVKHIVDMPKGRMGCQAATLNLMTRGDKYKKQCVVVVGGANRDEEDSVSSNSVFVYDCGK